MMRKGGNSKLREWFSERGVPNNMRISAKYHTPDAEYYGKRLKAQVEGKEVPAMPPRMPVDTSVDYSKGDPKGKEKLRGESDEDYIARQRQLNDEAKARMKAKFGGSGGSMGGVGSDPSYRPGGGGDDGGLGVGAALGSFWGNLSATTQSVASKAQEELAKREVGRKLREGWEATTSTLGDDEKRREASMAARGAVTGLWGSITSKVADLANPDDDDNGGAFPTFYDPAAKAAAPSTGMVGIGGGGGDEWDDWGDKRKPAPRRSSSSAGDGNTSAGATSSASSTTVECPGLPGEDRDGIAGLTGESEAQYAMRQKRIENEAKERMRLKFGGGSGGMGGVGSGASSSTSSSSSLPRDASSPQPPAIGGLRLSNSAPDVASPPKAPAPAGGSMPAPSPLSRAGSSTGSSTGSAPSSAKKAAEVDFFNDFGM